MHLRKTAGPPPKVLLWVAFAIPAAFVVAMLLRASSDASVAPNFAVLGLAGMILSLVMAIAGRIGTKRMQKQWLVALLCNALVVFVGLGLVDFGSFAGGGH